jgi:hypothetical protein
MAEPMDDRRCRATARSGQRCKRYAIPGGRVCVMHGGATPAVRAAARRRLAEAEATAVLESIWDPDAAPVTDPIEALAALAGKAQHAVDVLGAMVTTGQLDGAAAVVWSKLIRETRQMLEALDRLGLEERRVRLAEQAGAELAALVRRVLDQLGLTPEQQALASTVVPAEFRAIAGGQVVRGELE